MKIFYVGNYSARECIHRKPTAENYAGTMKMKFIIAELKKLGYKVEVVSLSIDRNVKRAQAERIYIDELEEHYFLPYKSIKIGDRNRGAGASAVHELYEYLNKNVTHEDIVIVYHAYAYSKVFDKLKRKKNIILIKQIEEVYCLSHYDVLNPSKLKKEEKMFESADGYLMVNEELARKYAKGKPYAISYGNYLVYNRRDIDLSGNVGIVYTGLISEDRGAFASIEAMKYLPDYYSLHILGFGNECDMRKMELLMNNINQKKERVFFYGTKTGSEYIKFLEKYHIGLSIMDVKNEIATNAFPSKILSYMGNSLLVLSSKSQCVMKSKLKKYLFYCVDNSPESIAQGIMSIPRIKYSTPAKVLENLEEDFLEQIEYVLKEVQKLK